MLIFKSFLSYFCSSTKLFLVSFFFFFFRRLRPLEKYHFVKLLYRMAFVYCNIRCIAVAYWMISSWHTFGYTENRISKCGTSRNLFLFSVDFIRSWKKNTYYIYKKKSAPEYRTPYSSKRITFSGCCAACSHYIWVIFSFDFYFCCR